MSEEKQIFDLTLDAATRQKILREIESEVPRPMFSKIPDVPDPDIVLCDVPGCEWSGSEQDRYEHRRVAESSGYHRKVFEQHYRQALRREKALRNDPMQAIRRRIESGEDVLRASNPDYGTTEDTCPRCAGTGRIGGRG